LERSNAGTISMIYAALFKRPKTGWLKQVRMRGAAEARGKLRQVIIGLFSHHHDFMDIELIVNPMKSGISIVIPKKCLWSTYQLKRVYKKPCGSLEVQFEFKRVRVCRRERPLKAHQRLLQ